MDALRLIVHSLIDFIDALIWMLLPSDEDPFVNYYLLLMAVFTFMALTLLLLMQIK